MRPVMRGVLVSAGSLVALLATYEIGWMHGMRTMQIEAEYSSASACYINLHPTDSDQNARQRLAVTGKECITAGRALDADYGGSSGLLGLAATNDLLTSDELIDEMSRVFDEALDDINGNAAQQGGEPQVSYEDEHITITGRIALIEQLGIEDGGTKYIKLKDATGVVHELYISHRLGHEAEWGTVFANAYMDEPQSVKLQDQGAIKNLLATIEDP